MMLHVLILKHGRSCRRQSLNKYGVELRLQPESFCLDIVRMRQSDLRPAHNVPLFLRRTDPPICRTPAASILMRQDVPDAKFNWVLRRNTVLVPLAPPLQRQVAQRVTSRVRPGGAPVIGIHESLPEDPNGMTPWPGARATIYRKLEVGAPA